MRSLWRGSLLALALASSAAWAQEQAVPEPPSVPEAPVLKPDDAERLFLKYIYDRASLIRSCMFLGGVKLGEIAYDLDLATVEIRYRIRCQQEEIDMPPLDRTMSEEYVYRYVKDHWELVGRASELPPSARHPSTAGSAAAPEKTDPTAKDRKRIAEQVLAWVALGTPPPGIESRFPGGNFFASSEKIFVSDENLGGVETLSVPGKQIEVLSPEALLQRTVVLGGGIWLRFVDTASAAAGAA